MKIAPIVWNKEMVRNITCYVTAVRTVPEISITDS
jgi:hypothetical protein